MTNLIIKLADLINLDICSKWFNNLIDFGIISLILICCVIPFISWGKADIIKINQFRGG